MSQPQTAAPRPYVPAAAIERRARRKRTIGLLAALVALIAAIGLARLVRALPRGPGPLRRRCRSLQVRLDRQRGRRGHPVLDLAGAAPDLPASTCRATAAMRRWA